MYLNTLSPVGDAIWEGYKMMTRKNLAILLEDIFHGICSISPLLLLLFYFWYANEV